MNKRKDYDAIVVGAGPNGLAAAITLQRNGKSVLLIEGKDHIGGGVWTEELTLSGFLHDTCSAIHPLAVGSPFFQTLPLPDHGLKFITPPVAVAHPFDDGNVAILKGSVEETAERLGIDREAYTSLIKPVVDAWPSIAPDVLGPFGIPHHPVKFASFGMKALPSALYTAKKFRTKEARGLWAGIAAHAIQPLSNMATSAFGLVLSALGHTNSWPIPIGGARSIADAMLSYFVSLGGKVQTGFYVHDLKQLPSAHAVLFDVTPKQLLQIAGQSFSSFYQGQLKRYRYGMGVFKIDWALDGPIPWKNKDCLDAGTVHLGNTMEEIAAGELSSSKGKHPEKPFVLLAQQSLFDERRAPTGKHTGWAYCHVPNGSTTDMTKAIEMQVERFAPGFRDLILARHTMNAMEMQMHNSNYIGGDINGGIIDIGQLFTRPALRFSPYKTSAKGLYICSSSTPPGGGVHGMCGYHAARKVLLDIFKLQPDKRHGNTR